VQGRSGSCGFAAGRLNWRPRVTRPRERGSWVRSARAGWRQRVAKLPPAGAHGRHETEIGGSHKLQRIVLPPFAVLALKARICPRMKGFLAGDERRRRNVPSADRAVRHYSLSSRGLVFSSARSRAGSRPLVETCHHGR